MFRHQRSQATSEAVVEAICFANRQGKRLNVKWQ